MRIYDWRIAPNPRRLHIYLARWHEAVSARPSAKA
jgi:hypothetical protein